MSLVSIPRQMSFTPNGDPRVGALWYFYEAGTDTLLTLYTTAAMDVELPNPVPSVGSGYFPAVYIDQAEFPTHKQVMLDAAGLTIFSEDDVPTPDYGLRAELGSSATGDDGSRLIVFKRMETGAVARTVNSILNERLSIADFGAAIDGDTDDQAAWVSAYGAADETISGAVGGSVYVPRGITRVTAQLTIPNHVATFGDNKEASYIQADPAHSGPFMFLADNSGTSMFDCRFERVTIDANNVAGLGCIESEAFQEGGGARDVLFYNYRTYGVDITAGDGGSSFVLFKNCEFFPSTAGATAGIRFNPDGSTNMVLHVEDTSIASSSGHNVAKGIDVVIGNSRMENIHFEYHDSCVYLAGGGFHVLENVKGGPGVTSLVEIDAAFTGTLVMIGCRRNGATNLIKDNRTGGLGNVTVDHAFLAISDSNAAGQFSGGPGNRSLDLGSDTQAGTFAAINGAVANYRAHLYRTAGVNRWLVGANADAEGGANAGSAYEINYYSDAGSFLGTIFSADRTGKLGFYGATRVAKPTVTGSKGANAALTSLCTQLAALGLITDSTS